jgi:hypothetical protein
MDCHSPYTSSGRGDELTVLSSVSEQFNIRVSRWNSSHGGNLADANRKQRSNCSGWRIAGTDWDISSHRSHTGPTLTKTAGFDPTLTDTTGTDRDIIWHRLVHHLVRVWHWLSYQQASLIKDFISSNSCYA